MTFSYDASLIALGSTPVISAVRWLVQDTVAAAPELQDEEINALFGATDPDAPQTSRVTATAVACAQALERRYRKQATFSSGGTSVQLTQRAEAWSVVVADLAAQLQPGLLLAGRASSFAWDDGWI